MTVLQELKGMWSFRQVRCWRISLAAGLRGLGKLVGQCFEYVPWHGWVTWAVSWIGIWVG